MSLVSPGEFPSLEPAEGEIYAPAPIPGVPAGAMPKLDFSESLLAHSLPESTNGIYRPTDTTDPYDGHQSRNG